MTLTFVTRARVLSTRLRQQVEAIPLLGRVVSEWRRVEVVDRAMVTAAQALLALVPLVIVLVAFLPFEMTRSALVRFAEITGLAAASLETAVDDDTGPVAADMVRAQIGALGALVTLLSASSFARAVMRAVERVWDVPHLTGFKGRRRALGWLLCWLAALQAIALGIPVLHRSFVPDPLVGIVQLVLTTAVWWWSLHVLLHGTRTWRQLVVPAALCGTAAFVFTRASALVMPEYSLISVRQFGALGLVLALATWLVSITVVLVSSGMLGRMLGEWLDARSRVATSPGTVPPSPDPESPDPKSSSGTGPCPEAT